MANLLDSLDIGGGGGNLIDSLKLGGDDLKAQPSGVMRRFADVPIAIGKGIADLPSAAVGLSDIITGGQTSRTLDRVFEALGNKADEVGLPRVARPTQWSSMIGSLYSPEAQAARERVHEAFSRGEAEAGDEGPLHRFTSGMASGLPELLTNPSAMLSVAGESLPGSVGMLGAARLAAGRVAKDVAKRVAAGEMTQAEADKLIMDTARRYSAVSEGALTAGQGASQISQENKDAGYLDYLTQVPAGAITAAITRGVSKIPGFGDVEAELAGRAAGARAGNLTGSWAGRVGKSVLSEGLFEEFPQSVQEQIWQNIGSGKPWDEGLAEQGALGAAAGGVTGGGFGAFSRGPSKEPAGTLDRVISRLNELQGREPGAEERLALPKPGAINDATAAPNYDQERELQQARDEAAQLYAERDLEEKRRKEAFDKLGEPEKAKAREEGVLIANPKAIFDSIKSRPAILSTIEKNLAEQPEAKAEPAAKEEAFNLDAAVKELIADPKKIFGMVTEQPGIYDTLARVIGETERKETRRAELSNYGREREALVAASNNRFDELTESDRQFLGTHGYVSVDGEKIGLTSSGKKRLNALANERVFDSAAHAAASSPNNDLAEPTEAQIAAGNYTKGHETISGMDISVESPAGSTRKSKKGAEKKWKVQMQDHYGYVKGVPARNPDKDHVDVFVKAETGTAFNGDVFIVDQNKANNHYDEAKVMIGYGSEREAAAAYHRNYEKGWNRMRQITRVPMERFKQMLQDKEAFLKPQPKEGAYRDQQSANAETNGTNEPRVQRTQEEGTGTQEKEVAKGDALQRQHVDTAIAVTDRAHPRELRKRNVPASLGNRAWNANAHQMLLIASAISDVIDAVPGLAKAADLVKSFGIHSYTTTYIGDQKVRKGNLAQFFMGSSTVTVREDLLPQDPSTELRQKHRGWLSHELWHITDRGAGSDIADYASVGSVAFDCAVEGSGPDMRFLSRSQLFDEIIEAINAPDSEGVGDFFSYPMSRFDNGVEFVQSEAFAQCGRLFTTNPELLKKYVPTAHQLFSDIAQKLSESAGVAAAHGAIRQILRRTADVAGAGAVGGASENPQEGARDQAADTGSAARGPDTAVGVAESEPRKPKTEAQKLRASLRLGKFVESLPKEDDGTFAGSRGKDAADVRRTIRRMIAYTEKGKASKDWYTRSAEAVMRMFSGDKISAERFIQLIAITSPHTDVKANFTAATKAMEQFVRGAEIHVGTKSMDRDLTDLLYFGIPWEGRKTNTFYINLTEAISGVPSERSTQDMHQTRLIFGKGPDSPTDAEYNFAEKLTKFVADEIGWNPSETQAAMWVTQKARTLYDRYIRENFFADKSDKWKRDHAMEEAAVHYGNLVEEHGYEMFGTPTRFEPSEKIRAKGQNVTAEVRPSTKTPAGRAVAEMSHSAQQKFQDAAVSRVFGRMGLEGFLAAFGLNSTTARVIDSKGAYENVIAPNIVVTVNADKAKAEALAKAWMYVFQQDAVPFYRFDASLADAENAAQGVYVRFDKDLTLTEERKFYDALRASVSAGLGYTRMGPGEYHVINFRGDDNQPFVVPDKQFIEGMQALVTSDMLPAEVVEHGQFGAETSYPYHDWREDPEGKPLRDAALTGGSQALQRRLDRWANGFRRFTGKLSRAQLSKEAKDVQGVDEELGPVVADDSLDFTGKPEASEVVTVDVDEFLKTYSNRLKVPKEARTQTDTPEFRKWFGKSKVTKRVDGKVVPRIMFHGTGRDIETFRPKQANAIFVTPDPEFAEAFADLSIAWMAQHEVKGGARTVYPVYVRAENPFDHKNNRQRNELLRWLDKNVPDDEIRAHKSSPLSRRFLSVTELWGNVQDGDWEALEHPAVQKALRALGHDGFWVREQGVRNLAVFDPNQVKSAVGNSGEFSLSDDRIQAVDEPAFVSAREPSVLEARPNSLRGNAKTLSDLLESEAFRLHGFSGLEVPAQRKVLHAVRSLGANNEIVNAVVDLLPVEVVNVLRRRELAPEALFHDEAVLKNLLSGDGKSSVAVARKIADSLISAVARVATEPSSSGFGVSARLGEGGAAPGANESYLSHVDNLRQIKTVGNNGDVQGVAEVAGSHNYAGQLATAERYLSRVKRGDTLNEVQANVARTPIGIMETPKALAGVIGTSGSRYVIGSGSTLYLKSQNTYAGSDHGEAVPIEIVRKLPQLLADPAYIFACGKGSMNERSFKVVLKEKSGDKPVVVAIDPYADIGGAQANMVLSIHPVKQSQVDGWIAAGLERYPTNKKPSASAGLERNRPDTISGVRTGRSVAPGRRGVNGARQDVQGVGEVRWDSAADRATSERRPWMFTRAAQGRQTAPASSEVADFGRGQAPVREQRNAPRGTTQPVDVQGVAERPEWVKQQAPDVQEALRKVGTFHEPESLAARVKKWAPEWIKRVRQGLFDQFDPIQLYDYAAYMKARLANSADAVVEGLLKYGTIKLDAQGAIDLKVFEQGGFIKILSKLQGEHDRFFAWVAAQRAEQLLGAGKEHNLTATEIQLLKKLNRGSMPDGQARGVLYKTTLEALQRYNKAVLDIAEKAGLVDGSTRPLWESEFYVPFYRLMESDEKGVIPAMPKALVGQYAFKKLKGGSAELGDLLENTLKNWAHLVEASLRNQAARQALEAAERVGVATPGDETTLTQMSKAAGLKGAVVHVVDGGTKRYFMVSDPFLLDAIKSIGFTGFSGPGMKVMQNFKRWLTFGVTISPTFRIRNIIRDSLQAIGTNEMSYNVLLKNLPQGWKGTREGSEEFGRILVGGGVMRYGTFLEGDRARHTKKLIEAEIDPNSIISSPEHTKAVLRKMWDWWLSVGDRSENVNRVALYKQLRDQGKSHLEAAFAARDTMDFGMQGTWAAVRFLSQVVPFFNARLQGLYKVGRGAKEDPRRFAMVLGATALASVALLLAYKDDDDWKAREDFDRETYWWFKVGDKAFRIPKPFEIGALATLIERGTEAMVNDEFTGAMFADRLFNVIWSQLSMNPTPQLFAPIIELWANKDTFTGRPIETLGMDKLSKSERIGRTTSASAQLAGKAGVLSPVQIDHLINGYFGWLGMHVVATADFALRPAMGLPGKPAMKVDDYFVVGDFVKDMPSYQSRYVTRMYDEGKKFQEALNDIRHYAQIGQMEKAKSLLEANKDSIGLGQLYQKIEADVSKLNSRMKMIEVDPKLDAEQKRAQLDQMYLIRNRLARIADERARAMRR